MVKKIAVNSVENTITLNAYLYWSLETKSPAIPVFICVAWEARVQQNVGKQQIMNFFEKLNTLQYIELMCFIEGYWQNLWMWWLYDHYLWERGPRELWTLLPCSITGKIMEHIILKSVS